MVLSNKGDSGLDLAVALLTEGGELLMTFMLLIPQVAHFEQRYFENKTSLLCAVSTPTCEKLHLKMY